MSTSEGAPPRQLASLRVRLDDGDAHARAIYKEPSELTKFSKTRHDGNVYDASQLKRYLRPSCPFDLSEGFDTFRDRDRGKGGASCTHQLDPAC